MHLHYVWTLLTLTRSVPTLYDRNIKVVLTYLLCLKLFHSCTLKYQVPLSAPTYINWSCFYLLVCICCIPNISIVLHSISTPQKNIIFFIDFSLNSCHVKVRFFMLSFVLLSLKLLMLMLVCRCWQIRVPSSTADDFRRKSEVNKEYLYIIYFRVRKK